MPTITRPIAQGSDDAYISGFTLTDSFGITDTTLTSTNFNGDQDYILGRFSNITIPQGATITNAVLKYTASNTRNVVWSPFFGSNPADGFACFGFDLDDVSTFTNGGTVGTPTNVVTRSASNSVVADTEYTSADISSIIQAVVDRGGWSSGNALAIALCQDPYSAINSSNGLQVHAYDGDPSKAMVLEITYDGVEPSTSIGKGGFILNFM